MATSAITFLKNGTPVGTAQTNAAGTAALATSLPAGMYTLSAAFAGNSDFAASASAPITEVVNLVPTTIALFAQPNPGYQNDSEAVTANVLAEFGNTVPVGTVTIFDGTAPIFTDSVDGTGSMTFSTTAFTVGRHIVTASFNPGPGYIGSNSAPYVLAILPRDFTLTPDPTITIQTEHHKNLTLNLASVGNFTDTIALSCGPMPADAYCTFASSGPLLAAGDTLPTTVRIDTDAISNYLSTAGPATRTSPLSRLRGGVALGFLLPLSLFAAARRRRNLRRALGLFASLCVFLIATAFTGCSSHYPGHTPPGTYTFTITGQGAATHVTHTATVTLIVTE